MKRITKIGIVGLFLLAMLGLAIATTTITDQGVTTPSVEVTDVNVTGNLTVQGQLIDPFATAGAESVKEESDLNTSIFQGSSSTTGIWVSFGKTFTFTATEPSLIFGVEGSGIKQCYTSAGSCSGYCSTNYRIAANGDENIGGTSGSFSYHAFNNISVTLSGPTFVNTGDTYTFTVGGQVRTSNSGICFAGGRITNLTGRVLYLPMSDGGTENTGLLG